MCVYLGNFDRGNADFLHLKGTLFSFNENFYFPFHFMKARKHLLE